LLFGTLFKYMDKEKEEGTEKSAEEAKRDNIASVDEKVEPVKESKSGEVPEPDLTTPPLHLRKRWTQHDQPKYPPNSDHISNFIILFLPTRGREEYLGNPVNCKS